MENKSITTKKISKDIAKQSIKITLCFVFIFILFTIPNLVYVIQALINKFLNQGNNQEILLAFHIIIGIMFIVISMILTKRYGFINTISIAYKYLTPFFRKIYTIIVDKVYDKSLDLNQNKHISKIVNITDVLTNSYERKIPWLLQKGIVFLLNRIPFADFFSNIQNEIRNSSEVKNDKVSFSAHLYEQADNYIKTSIFKGNNLYWIFWLFPLNMAIQFVINFLLY